MKHMLINEFSDHSFVTETRMVWRKVGNTLKRAIRCTAGPRKGRVVSAAKQCSAPINIKKRFTLKRTKSQFGKRMSRRARLTKKRNITSRRLTALNRSVRKR
jgi:hypothetical protein